MFHVVLPTVKIYKWQNCIGLLCQDSQWMGSWGEISMRNKPREGSVGKVIGSTAIKGHQYLTYRARPSIGGDHTQVSLSPVKIVPWERPKRVV